MSSASPGQKTFCTCAHTCKSLFDKVIHGLYEDNIGDEMEEYYIGSNTTDSRTDI